MAGTVQCTSGEWLSQSVTVAHEPDAKILSLPYNTD